MNVSYVAIRFHYFINVVTALVIELDIWLETLVYIPVEISAVVFKTCLA